MLRPSCKPTSGSETTVPPAPSFARIRYCAISCSATWENTLRRADWICAVGINALAARAKRSDWITPQLRKLRQEWSLLTIHRLGVPRNVRVHAVGEIITRWEEVEQ
jgi:hypothetical protein